MQVLYSMNRDPGQSVRDGLAEYRKSIEKSFDLYLFNLLQLCKIAGYSQKEYEKRKSKLLPTEEDKNFSPKLWDNPVIQSIYSNPELNKLWKQKAMESLIDPDTTRIFYNEFSKQEEYSEYLNKKDHDNEDHRKVIIALFKTCIKNEAYAELMEDFYPSWHDDESLVVGAMKKTIKSLPESGRFYSEHLPDDEAVKEFGEQLLQWVCSRDKDLLEVIEPTLQNWDVDRVAVLDMIMLKMAVCELLYFPTIPTKVTLNEFVEISKLYSTDKSKDFINGILDRLMKQLLQDGKINKEGRGLVE